MKTKFNFIEFAIILIAILFFQSCCSPECCETCPSKCEESIEFNGDYIEGVVFSETADGEYALIQVNSSIEDSYFFLCDESKIKTKNFGEPFWFKAYKKANIYYAREIENLDPSITGKGKLFKGPVKTSLDFHGFRNERHTNNRHRKFHLVSIGSNNVIIKELDSNGNPVAPNITKNATASAIENAMENNYSGKNVYIEENESALVVEIERCHIHADQTTPFCAH